MTDEKDKNGADRATDRRRGPDRRKLVIDPADLPFPDRRKGDRRQMDRRVTSQEETEELLKRIKSVEEEKIPAEK